MKKKIHKVLGSDTVSTLANLVQLMLLRILSTEFSDWVLKVNQRVGHTRWDRATMLRRAQTYYQMMSSCAHPTFSEKHVQRTSLALDGEPGSTSLCILWASLSRQGHRKGSLLSISGLLVQRWPHCKVARSVFPTQVPLPLELSMKP